MTSRTRALAAASLVLLAVAATIVIGSCGNDPYQAKLELTDALGLRNGSKVVIGGVQVGRVKLALRTRDHVVATLDIDRPYAPLGRDASAAITSVNLLGQKSLELNPGDRRRPAPSGFTIPAARVTPSTDLDQVLNVLDGDTRARLTILINEAGAAFTGRRTDFASVLQELPHSLTAGTAALERVDGDHRSLAELVQRSDRFVGTVTAERRRLAQLLDTVGQTSETFAARRAQLRSTLRQLPGTLTTARAFLEDLRRATVPLGPAARQLSATARPLDATLAELEPFTRAATPALTRAVDVAPELTRLADGANPVLRRAIPTLTALATLSRDLVPTTDALRRSVVNIVGVAANWAHAIQFRDGLSHVFRAEVAVTPQMLDSFVGRLLSSQPMTTTARRHTAPGPATKAPAGTGAVTAITQSGSKLADPVRKALAPVDAATQALGQLVGGLIQPPSGPRAAPGDHGISHVLDRLLNP